MPMRVTIDYYQPEADDKVHVYQHRELLISRVSDGDPEDHHPEGPEHVYRVSMTGSVFTEPNQPQETLVSHRYGKGMVMLVAEAIQAFEAAGVLRTDDQTEAGFLARRAYRQLRERKQLDDTSWQNEECVRVSGEAVCPQCERPYREHPDVTPEVPTFRRACDGRLLKL